VPGDPASPSAAVAEPPPTDEAPGGDGLGDRLLAAWLRVDADVERRLAPLLRVARDVQDRVRRHPVLGEVYEAVDGIFIDFGRDHSSMYAGALTFYAILSLIPLTVLFASVFGFFMSTGADGDVGSAIAEVVRQLRKVLPYLGPSFGDDLRTIVEYRSRLGVVGFVALLWAASEVFRGVEFSMARIFARVDDHENPDHHKTQARSVIITKLLFGVVASAVVIAYLLLRLVGMLLTQVRAKLDLPGWMESLLGDPLGDSSVSSSVVTAAGIVLGFVVLVRVFSPHQVQARFAAMGGVLFLVFFEGAHAVYDLYLDTISTVSDMYGSFATLIVLILWIYYCASLLLMCCHAVKTAQRRFTVGPRWPKDGKLLLVA
jgi:YihY family inner membrane protein